MPPRRRIARGRSCRPPRGPIPRRGASIGEGLQADGRQPPEARPRGDRVGLAVGVGAADPDGAVRQALEGRTRLGTGRDRLEGGPFRTLAQLGLPALLGGRDLGRGDVELPLQPGDLGVDVAVLLPLGRGRRGDDRRLVREVGVGGLVEEGVEAVIVLVGDRVVLVGVALGAAQRQAHPDLRGRVGPVLDGGDAELLVVGPPLGVGHRVAVEGGGHPGFQRGLGQQVAGDLLDGEPVVGQVAVEGVDDPVAIAPDVGPEGVGAESGRVGVAGQVEPDPRPPLAVAGVGEEPIDGLLVSVRGGIVGEGLDLARRGGEPAQVEADAPQEREAVGLGRRREPFPLQAVENPGVDPVPRPARSSPPTAGSGRSAGGRKAQCSA